MLLRTDWASIKFDKYCYMKRRYGITAVDRKVQDQLGVQRLLDF